MANKRFVIFNSSNKAIQSVIEVPDGLETEYLEAGQSLFEIFESDAIPEPDPSEHEVNAAGTAVIVKAAPDPVDSNLFDDPTSNIDSLPYYQWWYSGGPNPISNVDRSAGLDSWPPSGGGTQQQTHITNWVRELVDNGNSQIPDATIYNIEQIAYFSQIEQVVRFDSILNTRDAHSWTYVPESTVVIEARIVIEELFGANTILYQAPFQTIVDARFDKVDRQAYVDTILVNFEGLKEYNIKLQAQARYAAGVAGSTLGIATENFKLTRQVIG